MSDLKITEYDTAVNVFKDVLERTYKKAKDKVQNPVEYYAYKGVVEEMSYIERLLSNMILKSLFEEKECKVVKDTIGKINRLLSEFDIYK